MQNKTLFFLVCYITQLFLFNSSGYAQAEKEPPDEKNATENPRSANTPILIELQKPSELIAKVYSEDSVKWIKKDNPKALIIQFPNTIPITYGQLLFIADPGIAPGKSGFYKNLSDQLPLLGWNFNYLYSDEQSFELNTENSNTYSTELVVKAIDTIQSVANDELFIIVRSRSTSDIIKLLPQLSSKSNGAVFVLDSMESLSKEENRQALVDFGQPIYILYPNDIETTAKSWLKQIKDQSQKVKTTDVFPSQFHLDTEANFFAHRIHGWLKQLTLENPK
ncbi:hypothetical protein [Pleionea sediminis]|uniref:hypothetical protein n=1 Tax=Pleionea sediminis TaxID=2569479 RepID=UPI001186BD29|nr:hypothetical protein [Pleionea sediminis]